MNRFYLQRVVPGSLTMCQCMAPHMQGLWVAKIGPSELLKTKQNKTEYIKLAKNLVVDLRAIRGEVCGLV